MSLGAQSPPHGHCTPHPPAPAHLFGALAARPAGRAVVPPALPARLCRRLCLGQRLLVLAQCHAQLRAAQLGAPQQLHGLVAAGLVVELHQRHRAAHLLAHVRHAQAQLRRQVALGPAARAAAAAAAVEGGGTCAWALHEWSDDGAGSPHTHLFQFHSLCCGSPDTVMANVALGRPACVCVCRMRHRLSVRAHRPGSASPGRAARRACVPARPSWRPRP